MWAVDAPPAKAQLVWKTGGWAALLTCDLGATMDGYVVTGDPGEGVSGQYQHCMHFHVL